MVSGHEEFEYARSALKAGVVDYLLKPVKAEQLKSVLESVGSRIASDLYGRRSRALRDIASGTLRVSGDGRAEGPAGLLPAGRYSAAALRFGPPPSRFSVPRPAGGEEGGRAPPFPAARAPAGLEELGVWVLPGRDGSELLFVRSNELTDGGDFEAALQAAAEESGRPYRVLAFGAELFALCDLKSRFAALCRAVDESAVPGKALVIRGASPASGERAARPQDAAPRHLDGAALEGRMEFLVSECRFAELERFVREIFAQWEREGRPLVQASAQLRRLLDLVRRRASGEARLRDEELDALVEESAAESADYGELAQRAIEAMELIARRPARVGGSEDVPAFFASIKLYIEGNFPRDISLQSTCRAFSISQTYLSRLFRKHEGISFNDYLTGVRIEAAKRLMADSPDMPLKDVAALVGYQDQFYFSRVFKAAVGRPPSEYPAGTCPD